MEAKIAKMESIEWFTKSFLYHRHSSVAETVGSVERSFGTTFVVYSDNFADINSGGDKDVENDDKKDDEKDDEKDDKEDCDVIDSISKAVCNDFIEENITKNSEYENFSYEGQSDWWAGHQRYDGPSDLSPMALEFNFYPQ